MILTIDLGTSVTKAVLWDGTGMVGMEGVPLETSHPAPGRAEQNPRAWCDSAGQACARLRSGVDRRWGAIQAIGLTGARQSVGLFDRDGAPLGPALIWSDRRAPAGAGRRAGTAELAPVAAKLAWLEGHRPEDLAAATWVLGARDRVAWWLTDRVATDATMASVSGVYDRHGLPIASMTGGVAGKLPPVVVPECMLGGLSTTIAGELGVASGTPVVIGGGDRACEVTGSGAHPSVPMVSWGTTANVSRPQPERPDPVPDGLVTSRAIDGGWLLEGGLAAASSMLGWLGMLTGRTPAELASMAAGCPPGAAGVTAAPWLDGARAPWWRDDAGAAFVGISSAHGAAELSRAVFESVARDIARCLTLMDPGSVSTGLALAGGGAVIPVWREVLAGVTGLAVRCRRSGQAASVGAALVAASAVGLSWSVDRLDPVAHTLEPAPEAVSAYERLRPSADTVAAGLIDLTARPA